MLRRIELMYDERGKTESRRFAAEYVLHFLAGEPIPGIEYKYELYKKYLPGIRLEEVNRLADELITDDNRVVLINAPDKPGVEVPDEGELLAVLRRVEEKRIEPYGEKVPGPLLVGVPPAPAEIVEKNRREDLGITQWRLSNGISVILKPTDFKNDEVLFTAFSPGGHSLVPDEDGDVAGRRNGTSQGGRREDR
ncbi:MAG TPA: hypothetical protein EYP17_01075 [Candidatus Latescibacteria bacterium]|nr:hypothetical protein [Candidatus Latescibacterota bacterium]